jgi:cardiolipin synthase
VRWTADRFSEFATNRIRSTAGESIEYTYRTFTGSASIRGFKALHDNLRRSKDFYRRHRSLGRSVYRLVWCSVAVLVCTSIVLSMSGSTAIGVAMLVWTVPVIAIYAVFVLCNLQLVRNPGGEPAGSIQLANVITSVRIFLVPPIVVLLVEGALLSGMILYLFAACTDIADGIVARRLNQETSLGIVLDPVGDIVSTAAVFGFLWHEGIVPTWLFVVLVIRYAQFFAGLAVLTMTGMMPALRATTAGKVVGVVQATGIVILLASIVFPGALPFATIHEYLLPVLGIAFCSVIVSQTVIGWRAVKARGAHAANGQGG